MFCTPIFNVTTELGQLVYDPWEERRRRKVIIHEFITITVEVIYMNFDYLNMSVIYIAKPHPPFLATFINVKLALALLWVRFTRCMAAENME